MGNAILHLSRPTTPMARGRYAPSFEGDLSTCYLTLKNERYFVAQLLEPGDAIRKPPLRS